MPATQFIDSISMDPEFPGLKVGEPNDQTTEEEEVVGCIPRTFGKAADPIRIYLNEMKSFPKSRVSTTKAPAPS
jgi:hypothetical protein